MRGFGDGDHFGDGQGDGSSEAALHDCPYGYHFGDGYDTFAGFGKRDGNGRGWGHGTDPAFILRTTRSFDGHLINLYILGLPL